MYFPCLAVIGAARQEMGGFYAGVMAVYSTMLAWAVATLFYQIAEGHNIFYVILSFLILAAIYGGLHLLGKREKSAGQVAFAPPIRKSCCS
jgi:ferrous iron transport protein B